MKKSTNLVVLLFSCLFIGISLSAEEANLTKSIATRFSKLWYFAPQEKVYLHTDKPYYSAGEDIWISAHLVNAATHKPDTKSRYVYVELIDKSDSVITRIKLRRDSTGISGKIPIPVEFTADEYSLRAYTNWMQNAGQDFFFHKKIYIGNQIDDRIRMEYSFGKLKAGKIPLTLTFTNTYSLPLVDKPVIIQQPGVRRSKGRNIFVTKADGRITIDISPDSLNRTKNNLLEISIKEPGIKFSRKISIPDSNNDFDLQFFPESGVFLNNQVQTLGFKAVAKNGFSTEISGSIFNNKNEEVCEFRSSHKGMGKLVIRTYPGDIYYAIVKDQQGTEKRIQLPDLQDKGISLHLTSNRGRIYFEMMNQTNIPNDSLFLMAHTRGIVYLVLPLTKTQGQLPENIFPAGVTSFSVIDSVGNTYCERLHFNRNFILPEISMESQFKKGEKRSPVELNFKLLNQDLSPLQGIFSVSVTDNQVVKRDSLNDNILSYLLLSSDLKGYIEEPAGYFKDQSAATREKTDMLMLTQGWKRFETAKLLKGRYPKTDYFMEIGQVVTGKVLNLFNKPVKNGDVLLLSGYKNTISSAKTDSTGQFIIDGIEYPDSTSIILKAKSKSKIVDVEIIADKDVFPTPYNKLIFKNTEDRPNTNDYFQISKEKYYNEGGMMVVNLDELTITAEQKKQSNDYFYSGMADKSFDAAKLEEYAGLMVMDIISMFPGVQVNGDEVSIRGGGTPLYMIDGIETEQIEDVRYLNVSDIEEISLFRGPSASIFGSRGGNGVIAISLKKGAISQSSTPPSLIYVKPLGFQKPEAFYVPKYEVDSILKQAKPDLRTTIYWAPNLQTDKEGNITLKFFSADKLNDYEVELEGVSQKGDICRYRGVLKR